MGGVHCQLRQSRKLHWGTGGGNAPLLKLGVPLMVPNAMFRSDHQNTESVVSKNIVCRAPHAQSETLSERKRYLNTQTATHNIA